MMSASDYTKPCAQCGQPMGRTRGVCPECGHMTPWFKIRLFAGGGCAIIAFIGILIMLFAAIGSN